MNLVIAIIKPHKLTEVHKALTEAGVGGMTSTEIKGFGRQKGQTEIYRGGEYEVTFIPKVKIEVVVDKLMTNKIVEVISRTANTGKIGDGKIFVLDVKQALRVRTGEVGTDAL